MRLCMLALFHVHVKVLCFCVPLTVLCDNIYTLYAFQSLCPVHAQHNPIL